MEKTFFISDLSSSRNLYDIETETPQSAAGEESTYYSPSVLSSAHTYASVLKSHYATATNKRPEASNNLNQSSHDGIHSSINNNSNNNNNINNSIQNHDDDDSVGHQADELSTAFPALLEHGAYSELLTPSPPQLGGPCPAPLPSERLDTAAFHYAVAEVLVGYFAKTCRVQYAIKEILRILEAGEFSVIHVVYAVALLRRVTMADEEAEEAHLEECHRREEDNNNSSSNNNNNSNSINNHSNSNNSVDNVGSDSSSSAYSSPTTAAPSTFHHTFTTLTVRVIFPMALLIAAKVHLDWYPEMSHMVKVAGLPNTDFSRQRMSSAEVRLITALQYRVHITPEEFAEVEGMIVREAREYMCEM